MKRGGPLRRTELKRYKPLEGSSLCSSKPSADGVKTRRKTSASTVIPKKIRDAVMERDDRHCQRCGTPIDGKPYSRHHRDPRGMGGSKIRHTMANLVLLCGDALHPGYCHSDVESYRARATREGWLVPMGIRPEDWRCKRFGLQWEQPGATWVEAEPHPMQLDPSAPWPVMDERHPDDLEVPGMAPDSGLDGAA